MTSNDGSDGHPPSPSGNRKTRSGTKKQGGGGLSSRTGTDPGINRTGSNASRPPHQTDQASVELENDLEAQRKTLCERLRKAQAIASTKNFYEAEQKRQDLKLPSDDTKESWKQLLELYKKHGGAKMFTASVRRENAEASRDAMAVYEDSLYYQTPERRKNYRAHIDETKEHRKRIFKEGRAPMLWQRGGYEAQIEKMIETYENNHVGMVEDLDDGIAGPHHLHRHIPPSRRTYEGLGMPDPPRPLVPLEMKLDHKAIEAERSKHDDTNKDSENQAITHTERRSREIESLGDRPTEIIPTAGVQLNKKLKNGLTRQITGLFVAAAEKSSDWITSYDQMDVINSGITAIERKKVRKLDEVDNPPSPSATTSDDSEDNRQPEADGFLNEFCRKKKKRKKYKHLETTPWAETAYGRRERDHAHMFIQPSSPVLSPPHSPKPTTSTINIPTDISEDHRDFIKYRAKFRDQYGVRYKEWPEFREMRKRGRGYKIQYEPLDILAQLENRKHKVYEDVELTNEHGRYGMPAPDGTSMRLLREALGDEYRPPPSPMRKDLAPSDEEDSDDSEDSDNSEDDGGRDSLGSDDEGDLFRDAYLECSQALREAVDAGGGGADEKEPGIPTA
jgi:hypothetical protein